MRSHALLVIGLALFSGGCAQDRLLQQDLVDYKNESGLTLMLLQDQNDFLAAKFERVKEDMASVVEADRRFQYNFNAYSRRPDEIKLEIIEELVIRTEMTEQQQADFTASFERRLDDLREEMNDHRSLEISKMQAALDHEDEFFRFVYTSQDSVNGEFASRFDKKPWYQSLLGGWEDQRDDSGPESN